MLTIAQIAVSILIIILVLLQDRSSGIGGVFGGGGADAAYQTRRGMEKFMHYATILLIIIFAGLALLNLLL